MAWFINHYHHCGVSWDDEWSCCCNDECPQCGKEIELEESDDLTVRIVRDTNSGSPRFYIERSPEDAEDRPRYQRVAGPFATRAQAQARADAVEGDGDDVAGTHNDVGAG